MKKRKILGIDYGDFSIGLAIFDLETDFIFPYKTIFRDKANVLRKSIREIVDIVQREDRYLEIEEVSNFIDSNEIKGEKDA